MSTEEQNNPAQSETDSSEAVSLGKNANSNEAPSPNQTNNSSKQMDSFFHKSKRLLAEPKTWLEIIALFVVIVYTRFAGQQVDTMNKTFDEIKKQTPKIAESADAGKAQSALMYRQLESTLAVVLIFNYGLSSDGLQVGIENMGHSISSGAKGKITVTRKLLPTQKELGSASYEIVVPDLLPVDQPHLNQWGHSYSVPGLTLSAWDAVLRTEQSVTVVGSFSYNNGFGKVKEQSICSSYLWYRVTNSAGAMVGIQGFVPCAEFEIALRNSIEAKKQEAQRKKP